MKNTYKFKDSELLNKVLNDFDYSFQFGIHQIDALNNDKKDNFFVSLFKNRNKRHTCETILKTGLKNKWENIGYTVSFLGTVKDLRDNNTSKFLYYSYDSDYGYDKENNDSYNVIVAIPEIIELDKENYYLGTLDSFARGSNKDADIGIYDKTFNFKDLPKEFIYGYFHNNNGKYTFKENRNHLIFMDKEKRENFMKQFFKDNNIDMSSLKKLDKEVNNGRAY